MDDSTPISDRANQKDKVKQQQWDLPCVAGTWNNSDATSPGGVPLVTVRLGAACPGRRVGSVMVGGIFVELGMNTWYRLLQSLIVNNTLLLLPSKGMSAHCVVVSVPTTWQLVVLQVDISHEPHKW